MAIGYGSEQLYGGYENFWCPDQNIDPLDCPTLDANKIILMYPGTDSFYLAPDVDLSRIKTDSRLLKLFLIGLNTFKFPAPTLEYNGEGKICLALALFLVLFSPSLALCCVF